VQELTATGHCAACPLLPSRKEKKIEEKIRETLFLFVRDKMKAATRGSTTWWGSSCRSAASNLVGGGCRSALWPPSSSCLTSGSGVLAAPTRRQWFAAKAGGKQQTQQAAGGQASALSYFVARTASNGCGIVGTFSIYLFIYLF